MAVFVIIALCACQSMSSPKAEQKYSEVLSNLAFCDWNKSMGLFLELDSVASDGSRALFIISEQTEDIVNESWIEEGSVCNVNEASGKIDTILLKYGNAGVQIKVTSIVGGCRRVYHRTPRLSN